MKNDSRPTAGQIDMLCTLYDDAKIAADHAAQELSRRKGELLALIQDYGYVPAGAEKTMRLEGTLYVADATVASTVEINEAPVGELESELSRLRLPRVFRQLFARKVRHTLEKDAPEKLRLAIGGFTEPVQKRLLALFASCFTVNSKAPALSVDLAAALREKEQKAAEKAARKAARAAKK
jgi:hypothetical protein